MRCSCDGLDQDWQVEEIDLDPPKAGEVLVEWKAAGLCHSDEHLVTGDMVPTAEMLASDGRRPTSSRSSAATRAPASCVEVGPGVTQRAAGRPRLGQLRAVVRPLPLLLDRPAEPVRPRRRHVRRRDDHRRHAAPLHRRRRRPITMMAKLGTFAEHTVRGGELA